MPKLRRSLFFSRATLIFIFLSNAPLITPKSTIEPCSNADSCNALLGYTLYTDLKVSEVASLFQIDPISLLTANSIDISFPDVENHILPSQLFLKIPISCSCIDGIRKSVSTIYKTRPQDTLASIADSIYGGLVSADQIGEANSVQDPNVLDVGQSLVVPLPCTCFNGTDNSLPAIYLSYVVKDVDTVAGIAARHFTTITDLMNVNSMGSTAISPGDILAVPLSACASDFPKYASDYGLLVPNGSYAIVASHCVQCSCGPGNRNLYCTPASLAVSCSSMQCKSSNLMVGNVTFKQSGGGCSVTSCSYGGYANGTITTWLSTSLQPRCPGQQQFPLLIAPPTTVTRDLEFAPAPAPLFDGAGGGTATIPKSTVPASGSFPGFSPAASGPMAMGSSSEACSLVNSLAIFPAAILILFFTKFIMASPL